MREKVKIFECLRSCLGTPLEQFLVEIFALMLLAMKMLLVTC